MGHKNKYIAAKMELWFTQAYTLGNEFKDYINKQKIQPGQIVSVEQGIAILQRINVIDGLRMQITRACLYAKQHPELFPDNAIESNKSISQTFNIIEKQFIQPYEDQAREALEYYIESRKKHVKLFAYESELKRNDMPTREALIEQLKSNNNFPLNKSYKWKTYWKLVICSVIDNNQRKNEAWKDAYVTTKDYYGRVDEEVKNQIRDHVHDEYCALLKQHEHFMKWLNIYEQVILMAEKNIKSLSENMDNIANENAKLVRLFLRGAATAALAPLFLNGFIDPVINVTEAIIQRIYLTRGEISLNLNQMQIFQLTGFIPDSNKTTYRDAYKKLCEETVYDKIERYKKYLKHKIDTLSETKALSGMMTQDSTIWAGYSTNEIIRAHRMQTIDAGHYENDKVNLTSPDNENALIRTMADPLKSMVSELFEPLKCQYGQKDRLESLHVLLEKIGFDNSKVGPEAHNHHEENLLIKSLSNHMEIYYIVKMLVEETRYFGGTSGQFQLQHVRRELRDDDETYGLRPDNQSIQEVVMSLIKRIIKTDNTALKKILGLDPELPEDRQLKNSLLGSWTFFSSSKYYFKHYTTGCFQTNHVDPASDYYRRRVMIKAIVDEYYNHDITDLLQLKLVDFAKMQGVTLRESTDNHSPTQPMIDPKWISENVIKEMIETKTQPYIQAADYNKKMRNIFGDSGLCYYNKSRLIMDVIHLRAIEQTSDNMDNKKKRFKY